MDALLTDKRNVGIRIIVAAEKDAQQIVNAARTGKNFQFLQVQSHAFVMAIFWELIMFSVGMEYSEVYCRLNIGLST